MGLLTSSQCRAARGLLDWTQDTLAESAGVSRSTVRDFEAGRHGLHRGTQRQIVTALEDAGVLLIAAGDAGPGVRLREPEICRVSPGMPSAHGPSTIREPVKGRRWPS